MFRANIREFSLVLITLICCLTELLFYSVCNYLSSSPAICLLECRVDREGFLASSSLMEVSLVVPLEGKKRPNSHTVLHEPWIMGIDFLSQAPPSLFHFSSLPFAFLSYTKRQLIVGLRRMLFLIKLFFDLVTPRCPHGLHMSGVFFHLWRKERRPPTAMSVQHIWLLMAAKLLLFFFFWHMLFVLCRRYPILRRRCFPNTLSLACVHFLPSY